MRDQLRAAEEELAVRATAVNTEPALSDRESQLAKLMAELDQRSILVDAQKIEIIALDAEVEALKERLDGTSHQLRATEEELAVKATAVQNTERALSDRELQLAKLMASRTSGRSSSMPRRSRSSRSTLRSRR